MRTLQDSNEEITCLNAQARTLKEPSMPTPDASGELPGSWDERDIHIVVGIFSMTLASKFDESVTARRVRDMLSDTCLLGVRNIIE